MAANPPASLFTTATATATAAATVANTENQTIADPPPKINLSFTHSPPSHSSHLPTNDDDNDTNDDDTAFPLLAPAKIKIGSFSIRYKPRTAATERVRNYLQTSSYHDFIQSSESPLDYDGITPTNNRNATLHRKLLHRLLHHRHCLPLRILLLSLYLAFTLCSFWILDSIKEPTLAALVAGDLGRHQPRAKMVSFLVVVGVALGMEGVDRWRRRSRRGEEEEKEEEEANAALEESWRERNLPAHRRRERDGKWGWKRMSVVSGRIWRHIRWGRAADRELLEGQTDEQSSSKISPVAFYVVGSVYIHFFVTVAVALRQHPSFRPNPIFHEVNDVAQLGIGGLDAFPSSEFHANAVDTKGDWYYPFLGYALFALIESFGSVSITIFWAFANSHLTLEAAERHYGSIVAVAQAGAICGSTLSAVLGSRGRRSVVLDEEGRVDANTISQGVQDNDSQVTPILIFVACGCIAMGMGIMALYAQLFSKPMVHDIVPERDGAVLNRNSSEAPCTIEQQQHQPNKESGANGICHDLLGGLLLIFRYEYLKLVLAVSVLYEIALTCMHYELNLIGLDRFGVGVSIEDDSNLNVPSSKQGQGITFIQFMGWYGQTVNILSLFLSFYAFPRLIKRYGLSTTIRIFPTFLLIVTICAFVIFPQNLYFLFIALSICKALTYSVHDPSEEVLYMPTSDVVKFKAKFWIDVVGQRVAKAIGSAINNFAGSIDGIVKYGSLPSIVASIALWLACYQVGVLFDELIKRGDVVGLDDDENEGLELREGVETYPSDEEEDDQDASSPLFRDIEEVIPPPSLEEGEPKVTK